MKESNRCLTCGDEIPDCCVLCLSCIQESELECKATEWIRDQGWSEETLPTDEYVQMKDAYIAGAIMGVVQLLRQKASRDGFVAGAKAMQKENEQLKAKLENTERKIREISQKCYEVEDIESIISDLDNLSMELEE